MSLTNWAQNQTFQARICSSPRSIEQLQELVAGAERVKAVGARHSFTTVADSPGGVQISLDQMPVEVVVDPVRMTATVGAGMSYGAVADALQQEGYALANMASLPHISIAGGTATGTHGSGDRLGMLATSVAAVELITADGSLTRVGRTDPDFAAVAMGLGAFGVIARVDLDIEPTYEVRQDLYDNPSWETVLDDLDGVMASAYSVSLMGTYGGDRLREVWQKQRLDSALSPAPPTGWGGTLRDWTPPKGHKLSPQGGIPGPWSERMAHFVRDCEPSTGGDELQSEYFVARGHGVDALNALRALGADIDPHLWGSEIRTVAADNLWASPAYERASVCIGFTWKKHPPEVGALLPRVEAALEPFEPRPHFGKLFDLPEVLERFPKMSEFLRAVDRWDPRQKFHNPFLGRLRR